MRHHSYIRFGSHKRAVLFLITRHLSYSSTSTFSNKAAALNIAILSGSTRTEGPPSPILGPRVNQHFESLLQQRGHNVTVLDPKEQELPLLNKPHFAYAKSRVPPNLQQMHDILNNADCYVTITPEYNHAPSPGLLNLLNHFGSSAFSFKPSAIVSYSAGQWGGTRAAHSLRPVLSELGCLPVSAMVHTPNVKSVLDEHGNFNLEGSGNDNNEKSGSGKEREQKWMSYVSRCITQLEWWADATKEHRKRVDPLVKSPAFSRDPSQRNAL